MAYVTRLGIPHLLEKSCRCWMGRKAAQLRLDHSSERRDDLDDFNLLDCFSYKFKILWEDAYF